MVLKGWKVSNQLVESKEWISICGYFLTEYLFLLYLHFFSCVKTHVMIQNPLKSTLEDVISGEMHTSRRTHTDSHLSGGSLAEMVLTQQHLLPDVTAVWPVDALMCVCVMHRCFAAPGIPLKLPLSVIPTTQSLTGFTTHPAIKIPVFIDPLCSSPGKTWICVRQWELLVLSVIISYLCFP